MQRKKVVLAYSGGLDTSYCLRYLSVEKNFDVYALAVNTGGFSPAEVENLASGAKDLGAKQFKCIDVTEAYYYKCIRFLVYGNVLKNHTYPLSVSAERVFQAMAVANYAVKIKADCLAHGSTGAGNDQVRFDLIFNIMAPEITILSPIRDQKISREEEIRYLKDQGVKRDWQKSEYSVNQGLWGTSVGGKETLKSDGFLPDRAYPTKLSQKGIKRIEIGFNAGQFTDLDGHKFDSPIEAIRILNQLAAPYGIGRDIHVGDTIVGIKGRVGFEAAAPILIIKGHEALEKHVLSKWQIHWKEQLANWYGMLLHEGQYLDPVMRNIESFLEDTQTSVTGKVFMELAPHRFHILGIESQNDLMCSQFGLYGEMNSMWNGDDVRGFAKILSNAGRIHRAVNRQSDED